MALKSPWMEVSALRYQGGLGLHGRTPLHRLQSDERLIALVRRGNSGAFEVLVSRYHARLLAFCRHILGSKEDAEDVLQEVFAAAFNAIVADDRPINVRPWLYRIARNRSLNHLRRAQAIGVDSMDVHFSENGATTADKVHDREQFRLLVNDIQGLPETQRTALVLREMDALSYDQIAEAMDTTVPGVKSLLVRARISLAEAAEARQLSCDEVRIELAEVAEGLHKRPSALVRRHLRACTRCETFQTQLKQTNKALAALFPIGPLALLRHPFIAHLGHSAGTGSGATAGAAGATGATTGAGASGVGAGASGVAAGQAAAAAGAASSGAAFGSAGGLVSAGAGALASKAAAGLAAAALVTGAAVEASHIGPQRHALPAATPPRSEVANSGGAALPPKRTMLHHSVLKPDTSGKAQQVAPKPAAAASTSSTSTSSSASQPATGSTATASKPNAKHPAKDGTAVAAPDAQQTPPPVTPTQTDPTVLNSAAGTGSGGAIDSSGSNAGGTTTTLRATSTGPSCPPPTDSTATTPAPTTTSDPASATTATPTTTSATAPTPTAPTPTAPTPTSTTPTSTDPTTTAPRSADPASTTPSNPSASGGVAPPAASSPGPHSAAGCTPPLTPGP